jgi:hypothetical protein
MSPLIDTQVSPEANTRLTDGFNVLALTRSIWATRMDLDYVGTTSVMVIRHLVATKSYSLY